MKYLLKRQCSSPQFSKFIYTHSRHAKKLVHKYKFARLFGAQSIA